MNKNYVWIAIGLVVFLGLSAYVLLDDSGDDGYPSHTVTYVGNGGVLSDGSDTYVKTTSRAADCEFSNPGYVFVTWSTVPDASGSRYDDGGVFKDDDVRVLYAIWGYPVESYTSNINPDAVYYYGDVAIYIEGYNVGWYLKYRDALPAQELELRIAFKSPVDSSYRYWSYDEESDIFNHRGFCYSCKIDIDGANILSKNGFSNVIEIRFVPTGPLDINVFFWYNQSLQY